VRKYLFNGAVLGSAFSSFNTVRTGLKGQHDWRFYAGLAASILTLAVAVGTVREESKGMKD